MFKRGKDLIGDAIGTFEDVASKLKEGVSHCEEDVKNHQIEISAREGKIRELQQHIIKGNAVLGKVQALIEV